MPAFTTSKTKLYIDSIGEVSLRTLTLGDTETLFEIVAKRNSTDKEFAQEILFLLLLTPKVSKEDFEKIGDEDLIKITKAFIETEKYTFENYQDTGDVFSDFRRTITESVQEDEKRVREFLGSSIKIAENLAKSIKGIYIPKIELKNLVDSKALEALQSFTASETTKELNRALTLAASVDLQPFRSALLVESQKSVETFTVYWKNYYALNEKVTTMLLSTFKAQNLYPQQDFTGLMQTASQLSIRNERVFAGRIRELHRFPEEQRTILYKKAAIQFFSIDDIEIVLLKIKKGVETDSQLMFWESRTKGIPAKNRERIVQGHVMGLLRMGLPDKLVCSFQQVGSGSGIIDIILIFSNEFGEQQKVILELKVFEEGHHLNDGIEQTAQYMEDQETEHGYRVIFNATKGELEERSRLAKNGKTLKDIIININKPNPSSLDTKNYTA